MCNPDYGIGDFLETDAGFVWIAVTGVSVYSCYLSRNEPLEVFEIQILLPEESLSEAIGRNLIAGDFNSKSPDKRKILIGEMVSRNDQTLLNRSREMTFRRGARRSIIDLTIAAPCLASRIGDWCVLEVTTLSSHRCIEFSIQEQSHPVNRKERKGRSSSWNTRRLSNDNL